MASLVAAASGAAVLQPANPPAASAAGSDTADQSSHRKAARSLTLGAVEQARQEAVTRASRARAADATARKQAAQQRKEKAEFAAWEKERTAEINETEREAGEAAQTELVLERTIDWHAVLGSYQLSAGFGQAGSYWSSGSHTGQDFAAPSGATVYAAGAGEVIAASYDGAYGNRVKVRHEDGTETWYAHLSEFAVSAGQWVSAGDVVGSVGSTGQSTGPHLHFEVRAAGGDAVEPLSWLRERGVGM